MRDRAGRKWKVEIEKREKKIDWLVKKYKGRERYFPTEGTPGEGQVDPPVVRNRGQRKTVSEKTRNYRGLQRDREEIVHNSRNVKDSDIEAVKITSKKVESSDTEVRESTVEVHRERQREVKTGKSPGEGQGEP